ncbi:MAG TPA: hypothetical protein DCZ95_00465 [Verrucomicrobia bacterium]|nr:MAG: hypothetical protein A2X46_05895 [Lentisphaerae bacterium GWF2_57_35]HBA82542.1 hypothetical protein [Verrucomicrobiota bacterium]
MGWIRFFIIGAIMALGTAVRGAETSSPQPRLAIWCEFLPYTNVTTQLPTLARHRCDLIVHVERKDIGSSELAALCRQAREQGISVTAWLLLPYEEHLYVGEDSLPAVRKMSLDFAAWSQEQGLGVSNIVFDCEPSPLLGRKLFEKVRQGRILGLADVMKAEVNSQRFQRSVDDLNRLIDELHGRGFKVWGAGNRVFLDFLAAGQANVQDALNAPFTMIHWDRISFIAYRYQASQAEYIALIKRCAELAHRFFPGRAGLDIGLLGDHRHIPENAQRAELFGGGEFFMNYLKGMRSAMEIQEIVSVALAKGVTDINLYSLDGAVDSVAGLDNWLMAAGSAKSAEGFWTWTPFHSLKLGSIGNLLPKLYGLFVGPEKVALQP